MSKRHPLRDNVDLPEENGDPPEWRWRSSAVIADDDFQKDFYTDPIQRTSGQRFTSKVGGFHPQTPGCFCPQIDSHYPAKLSHYSLERTIETAPPLLD